MKKKDETRLFKVVDLLLESAQMTQKQIDNLQTQIDFLNHRINDLEAKSK